MIGGARDGEISPVAAFISRRGMATVCNSPRVRRSWRLGIKSRDLIMKNRLALLLVVAFTTTAVADEFDEVRDKIKTILLEENVPSLAVAVAQDGNVIWEEGFGWADRENQVKATEHTMYSLASISKPITATGLMVLVERGEVDLDRRANAFLGDAKLTSPIGPTREATVRRLANHTSGLPLHYQFFYEDEPYWRPAMDESIRRYGVLVRPPGERFQYANFGYGVLDHIISLKSGLSYKEFMRKEVFLPLGMPCLRGAPACPALHARRPSPGPLPRGSRICVLKRAVALGEPSPIHNPDPYWHTLRVRCCVGVVLGQRAVVWEPPRRRRWSPGWRRRPPSPGSRPRSSRGRRWRLAWDSGAQPNMQHPYENIGSWEGRDSYGQKKVRGAFSL